MAGIKAPLLDILTKLSTLIVTNGDGKNVGIYARVWNNQLRSEHEGKLYDFPKPAVFVEIISPVQYQEIGENFRNADLGINIHLVHEYFNDEGNFEQDLLVFDLRDQIIALLSQYKPTGCGLMVCLNEQQDFDHDSIYHFIIGFVVNFTDSKGSPYDPSRGGYIDSVPPTNLEIDVTIATTPVYDPGQQDFKIIQ
jgi:hypothetical protein